MLQIQPLNIWETQMPITLAKLKSLSSSDNTLIQETELLFERQQTQDIDLTANSLAKFGLRDLLNFTIQSEKLAQICKTHETCQVQWKRRLKVMNYKEEALTEPADFFNKMVARYLYHNYEQYAKAGKDARATS